MKKEVQDNLDFLADIGAMEHTKTQDTIRLDDYKGEHREMLRRKYFVGPYSNNLINPWFHTDKYTKSMIQKDFKCKIDFEYYRNNEELYGATTVYQCEVDLEEMGMAMPDHFRVDPMVEESDTSPKASLDLDAYNALEAHLKQGLKKRFIMLLNYDTYFSFYRAVTNTYLTNGFVYEYQNYQIKSAVKEIAKQLADPQVVEFLKNNRDTNVYRDKSILMTKSDNTFEIIPNEFEPEFIRTYQSALQSLYGFKMTPDTNIQDLVKTITTEIDMREEVLYIILPQEVNLQDLHQEEIEDEIEEELVEVE
jgi:hypothetical protein